MTIEAIESSTQIADFFETYDFVFGNGILLCTSAAFDKDLDVGFYPATTIERTGFTFSNDMSARACTITIPMTSDVAQWLIPSKDMKPLSVYIFRYFSADLTTPESIFIGYSTGVSYANGICNIEFQSILLELERQICRVRMQALCNNTLFDDICDILPSTYSVSTMTAISSDGKILTSASFTGGTFIDGFFTSGKASWNGLSRFITKHIGTQIYLQTPFDGLTSSDVVSVVAGCSKHPAECITKFDNLTNFVGMPYIPLKDSEKVALTNG